MQESSYTVDLVYHAEFKSAQSPLSMYWTALAHGVSASPVTKAFVYCDLGCGDGNLLNMLACSYPHARFVGIDINPEHIRIARELAQRAGLTNVTFIEAAFDSLQETECGEFDFISIHGTYSWLSSEIRESVRGFISRRLKPDGLFSIHYLALPGAASDDLVASYIRLFGESAGAQTATRFSTGVQELRKIAPFALLFQGNRFVHDWLNEIDSLPADRLAHDFMNRQAPAFHFRDVCSEFGALGLNYLGSPRWVANLPEMRLSSAKWSAYGELIKDRDRDYQESVLDLVAHTQSRVDLYGHAVPQTDSKLKDATDLYLQRVRDQSDLEPRRTISSKCAADLTSELHDRILALCEKQAVPVPDLFEHRELTRFGSQEIERAVQQLLSKRFLYVLVARPVVTGYDSSRQYRLASRLNQIILEEQIASTASVYLASTVLGAALEIPEGVRVRLFAFLGGDLSGAWRVFSARRQEQAPGSLVAPFEQFQQRVVASLPGFVENELPHLLQLGIVEAVS